MKLLKIILVGLLSVQLFAQTKIKNPTLDKDPTQPMQAATKQYVDNHIFGPGNFVALTPSALGAVKGNGTSTFCTDVNTLITGFNADGSIKCDPTTFQIGTTTTLPQGSQVTVTNTGTGRNVVLNFGIPSGANATTTATGVNGDFSIPGTLTSKISNGVWNANAYTGADPSVQVNACIADVIAAGGGICDARAFTGIYAMSQTISVGNTSLVPVTLLLPNTGSWQWSSNIGTSCAVTLQAMGAIIGSSNSGEGQRFSFQGTSGFSGTSVFCTAHPAGTGSATTDSYYRAEHFNVRLAGGTATVAATQLKYGADSTVFRSINTNVTQGSVTPTAVLVDNMCCGASLYNVGSDSGADGLGGLPGVHTMTFGSAITELSVFGGSAVHAGAGGNNIFMNFNNALTNPHIHFYGMYIEQSQNADNTTPQIQITSATTGNRVSFFGVSCLMKSGSTAYCIDGDVNTYIDVRGGLIRGEGATQYFLNDHRAGYHLTTGAGGQLPDYSTASTFSSQGIPSNLFVVKSNMGDLDTDAVMGVDSGKTVPKVSEYCYYDRGIPQWCWQKDAANALRLFDWQNAVKNRLTFVTAAGTNLHSGGTAAVGFNNIAGTGTGGVQGGDGTGAITWSVSGGGKATYTDIVTKGPIIDVRSYGTVGNGSVDDTAAIQAAVTAAAGRPVYLPAGTYKITSTITYSTSGYTAGVKLFGDGRDKTIIQATAPFTGTSVFSFVGTTVGVKAQFAMNGYVKGMTITTSGAPAGVGGISLVGQWEFTVEGNKITGLTGDGIVWPLRADISSNPDDYASAFNLIIKNEISFNTGWGVDMASGLTSGNMRIEQNRIGVNALGGIYQAGHNNTIARNSIFSNGCNATGILPCTTTEGTGGGLVIDRVTTGTDGLLVRDNEFDSNYSWHIWLKTGDTGEITGNRFIQHRNTVWVGDQEERPLVSARLSGAALSSRNWRIERNYQRSDANAAGVPDATVDHSLTMFLISSDSSFTRADLIKNQYFPADNTGNMVAYSQGGGAWGTCTGTGTPTCTVGFGGYYGSTAPTVKLVGAGCTGTATATVSGGAVTAITTTSVTGCTVVPYVVFVPAAFPGSNTLGLVIQDDIASMGNMLSRNTADYSNSICLDVTNKDTCLTRVALNVIGVGGLKINGDSNMTAAPRMLWSCFAGSGSSVQAWCKMPLDKAITLTRVYINMNAVAVAGCTTSAVVRVGDGTNNVDVPLANGVAFDDSGAVAVNVAAAATLTMSMPTAPVGCTTAPANLYITAQYRMQ